MSAELVTTTTPAPDSAQTPGQRAEAMRLYVLQCDDIKYEPVTVPEWNGAVIVVRTLTGEEKDSFEESVTKKVKEKRGRKTVERTRFNNQKARAKLVIAAACVAVGNPTPLFNPTDLDKLATKSGAALDRLFDVAQRLAGFTDEDIEELGKE